MPTGQKGLVIAMYLLNAPHFRLIWVVAVIMTFWTSPVSGGSEATPELRQLIKDAGMVPWRGQAVPLDETLRRGSDGEKIQLRQYVTGKDPLLVYMYGYW